MHSLDRPVWASLSTHHTALSVGSDLARRYSEDVNLFAAARDTSDAALKALADLVPSGEKVFLVESEPPVLPQNLCAQMSAIAVQMIAIGPIARPSEAEDIVTLSDQDAPEMVDLATLTEPGPFLARTHTMGHFRGIRIDGRLAAMAGERMHVPGFIEVSGVCTHPDFRGRGLARRLSALVAADIQRRGETPFLHSWQTNAAAISLYEKLGFEIRAEMNVVVAARRAA